MVRGGAEIVPRDCNLPVARLIPISAEDASEEELLLVAAGKMRPPKEKLDLHKLLKPPTARASHRAVTKFLLDERERSLERALLPD